MNVYISDTHFGHANIMKYCDRKFKNVAEMDAHMWSILSKFDADGHSIFFMGDWGFSWPEAAMGGFKNWHNHVMIYGNHDNEVPSFYTRWFGTIVGRRHTWKEHTLHITDDDYFLVLSHEPQKHIEKGYINLYGHHHNNMTRYPEKFEKDYPWLFDRNNAGDFINVSVELTNYTPVTIKEAFNLPIFVR